MTNYNEIKKEILGSTCVKCGKPLENGVLSGESLLYGNGTRYVGCKHCGLTHIYKPIHGILPIMTPADAIKDLIAEDINKSFAKSMMDLETIAITKAVPSDAANIENNPRITATKEELEGDDIFGFFSLLSKIMNACEDTQEDTNTEEDKTALEILNECLDEIKKENEKEKEQEKTTVEKISDSIYKATGKTPIIFGPKLEESVMGCRTFAPNPEEIKEEETKNYLIVNDYGDKDLLKDVTEAELMEHLNYYYDNQNDLEVFELKEVPLRKTYSLDL